MIHMYMYRHSNYIHVRMGGFTASRDDKIVDNAIARAQSKATGKGLFWDRHKRCFNVLQITT